MIFSLHAFLPGAALGCPCRQRVGEAGAEVVSQGQAGQWVSRVSRPWAACVALARHFVCAGGGLAAAGKPSQSKAKRECSGSPSWQPKQSYLSLCAFSFSSVYSRLQWLSLHFAFQSQASPLALLSLGCPFTPSVSSSSSWSSTGSQTGSRCLQPGKRIEASVTYTNGREHISPREGEHQAAVYWGWGVMHSLCCSQAASAGELQCLLAAMRHFLLFILRIVPLCWLFPNWWM